MQKGSFFIESAPNLQSLLRQCKTRKNFILYGDGSQDIYFHF